MHGTMSLKFMKRRFSVFVNEINLHSTIRRRKFIGLDLESLIFMFLQIIGF
jgi:hypothetical protein